MRFLTGHRRAFHGSLDKVESALREEKSVNPSLIPYKLTATAKYPDYYLLCYMPSQRMKKEYIKVTPAGYSYRQQVFDSIEKLLQYFKLHYKDKSQPPQPRWPRRQPPAPITEQQSHLAHRTR